MATSQPYGKNLPDQVDRIASLSDVQLELLEDVRDLFRDRVTLERDYAAKLQLLAKKAADKKSKKIATLVIGNEPTKAWDENTLRQSTLDQAYSQLITSVSDSAQDHIDLSDALDSQVISALKTTEKRHDEASKKQTQYFQKLLSDRDRAYADRLKSKQKYDEECTEVEAYRLKQERSTDDRHAERAAKQYEQQQADMLNSKNSYLISITVANKTKAKYFDQDLPALEDQFQELQTQLLNKLSSVVVHAQALQSRHLDALKSRVAATENAFTDLSPSKDQDLFIDHNIRAFSAPLDWGFEPCATHYDTGDMNIEPAPKVYLQNRLSRCKQKLQELHPVLEAKRKEVQQLSRVFATYSANNSLGNVDEVSDSYLEAQHQFAFYATSECTLKAEIDTILTALGGDEGAQCPHTFKSSSFSIPTQCSYCKSTIWGLSKQGKTCKACGISVHSKCELKVAADCPGSRGPGVTRSHTTSSSISQSSISRSDSTASSTSNFMTPTPSSFAHSDSSIHSNEDYPLARVVFDFIPTSPFELAVTEGESVQVLEPDDGSGWIKVGDNEGGKGLVPASYIELLEDTPAQPPPVNVRNKPGTKQRSSKFVRGLYDYQAQGADELPLREGEMIELSGGPHGGQNYAAGWWEGIDSKGKKGIFPSNYVELVP